MAERVGVPLAGTHAAPTAEQAPAGSPTTRVLAAARRARAVHQLRFDSGDQEVVRLPAGAAVELIRRLAVEVASSVQQIMPLTYLSSTNDFPAAAVKRTPAQRDADDFSQVVSRNLAELDRRIERIYLLPRGHARAEAVRWRLTADRAARIDSRFLRISDLDTLAPGIAPRIPVSHVWIVDGRTVLFQESTPEGPPVWTVSTRDRDLSAAQELWKHLSQATRFRDADFDLIDPLVISADQLAVAAPLSCRPVDAHGSCDWYHGAWQYLRLFDMVANPSWHDEFYRTELRRGLGAVRNPRVMIAGTADYSTLAYVLQAWNQVTRRSKPNPAPQIDVVDLCPTPLNACRWYAAAMRHEVRTYPMDLRQPPAECLPESAYDLIVSDDLLTGLSGADSFKVLRNWRSLLSEQGRVVTTIRVVSKDQTRDGVYDETADFAARARQAGRRWRSLLAVGLEDICDAARRYADRVSSVDHGTEAEICAMFEKAGLRIVRRPIPERRQGEFTQSTFLRVVAARIDEAVDTSDD